MLKNKILLFLIIILMPFMIYGCFSDKETAVITPPEAESLTGLWKFIPDQDQQMLLFNNAINWNSESEYDIILWNHYIKFNESVYTEYIEVTTFVPQDYGSGGPEEGKFYYCNDLQGTYTYMDNTVILNDVYPAPISFQDSYASVIIYYGIFQIPIELTFQKVSEDILLDAVEGEFCTQIGDILLTNYISAH